MGSGAFSRVLTGWTGSIVVTTNSIDVTITPFTRDSAASLLARMVQDVIAQTSTVITISVSSAGVITLTGSASFNIVLTTNCTTRTGLTGSYTGASTYTAAGAYTGAWVPAYGIRQAAPLFSTTGGAVVSAGTAYSGRRQAASTQVIGWDSTLSLPDTTHEYDYWHDGRVFGRFQARNVRRVPMGRARAVDQNRIEFDVVEVS